jgi:predicted PurR-regulated permease PerM
MSLLLVVVGALFLAGAITLFVISIKILTKTLNRVKEFDKESTEIILNLKEACMLANMDLGEVSELIDKTSKVSTLLDSASNKAYRIVFNPAARIAAAAAGLNKAAGRIKKGKSDV